MLSIKAPIKTVLQSDFLNTNESFCQRILGNYKQIGSRVLPEDLMHVVTQPPEIFLMGGGETQFMNQTDVSNIQIQKVEVLNSLLNRILIAADGHLTYQDQVYITNALHKFGITNQQEFMHQVYRLTQDTKLTNQLLSEYRTDVNHLAKLVSEYAGGQTNFFTTQQFDEKNEILHLHEGIFKRWQAGDVYRMQQSFRYSPEGKTFISGEIFAMAEQIRLSEQIELQQLRESVRGEFVPLVYHHENVFEGADGADAEVLERHIEERIAAAVLLSLTDNLYQSAYNRVDHSLANWYHTEYAFYKAGENVFNRMEGNTSYRQLLYEESRLSDERQYYVNEERNILQQLRGLSIENEYLTQTSREGDAFTTADMTFITEQEGDTEVAGDLTQNNTFEQQIYQQNLKNERRQQEYLTNLQQLVEGYREVPTQTAQERTKRDTLFALENPEEFKREYIAETERQKEQREALIDEAIASLPKPQQRIAELIRSYMTAPVQYLESNMVSNEDLTYLYYDSLPPEESERFFESVRERVVSERLRTETALQRSPEEEQLPVAEGAQNGERGALQEAVGPARVDAPLVYREEAAPYEDVIEAQEEGRVETLVERQREYNRQLQEIVLEVSKVSEKRSFEEVSEATEALALTHRIVSEQSELLETDRIEERERTVELNRIERVIEDIRREPVVQREERESLEPETVHFVHRSTQSSIDEETINELRESIRRQETSTALTTETAEHIQNVENRYIHEQNQRVVTERSEEEIARIVSNSIRGKLDEITGKVYGRIEKQLNNERRRRGM